MTEHRRTLSFVAAAILFAAPSPAQETGKDTKPDPLRATIVGAIDWIARQAVPVPKAEHAVQFPANAEQKGEMSSVVYGGSAGVLIFLENAAKVLDDARARTLADETAAGLLAVATRDDAGLTWAGSRREEGSSSLYVGDAGIGAAFLVRARLRHDDKALKTAQEIGDALIARGHREGDELSWDKQVEVIYGASGTALFLLDLADASGEVRYRDAAHAVGRWLVGESDSLDTKPRQRCWRWQLAGDADYTGFSHGTAGVAYTLLRIGNATGDDTCTQAGKDGTEWVLAHGTRKDGLLSWPVRPRATVSLGGWCHGPPGTARPFLFLHALTGEARCLDVVRASAQWVEAQAGPKDSKIPPSFPPSYCCGVAGVVDFFCDLYRVSGDPADADFARRAADYLVNTAQADGDGFKWANGANAHQSDRAQHGVDLMLGASGEAYALLRVLALDQKVDPMVQLPDRCVTVTKG